VKLTAKIFPKNYHESFPATFAWHYPRGMVPTTEALLQYGKGDGSVRHRDDVHTLAHVTLDIRRQHEINRLAADNPFRVFDWEYIEFVCAVISAELMEVKRCPSK